MTQEELSELQRDCIKLCEQKGFRYKKTDTHLGINFPGGVVIIYNKPRQIALSPLFYGEARKNPNDITEYISGEIIEYARKKVKEALV